MPAALQLQQDTQDLHHHSPAPSKVINPYCKGAEKKKIASPLVTTYARKVKWSRAKAELRAIEGNRSWEGKKKKQLVHGY